MTASQDTALPPAGDPAKTESVVPSEPRKGRIDWWAEVKGVFWLLAAVLGFHSLIAKPFYIPSESMMPNLLVGDRLVVSKFAYGWSHVSPTIPNPAALFRWLVLHEDVESLAFTLPPMKGRLWGSMPERGDVVILTPPGKSQDWIKRVIGLPGDRIAMKDGHVILNGVPIKRAAPIERLLAVDANAPCHDYEYAGRRETKADGRKWCRLPIIRETLPNGKSYDTIDLGPNYTADNFGPITVPDNHVFLMGDNRDHSADSRFPLAENGLGGPVPVENIGGRAVLITFSLDGSTQMLNPLTWFSALRGGRAGTSLSPDEAK